MEFSEYLRSSAKKNGSIVCFGFDPVLEKIPLKETNVEKKISRFFEMIIDKCEVEKALPAAVKPNYAFFAQYGFDGLKALKNVISFSKERKIPLILDAKRGDIGKTAEAYAKEAFEFWGADALTVNPYMGSDTLMPYVKYCQEKEKGIFVLNRTSNPGAAELQNLEVGGKKLYMIVAEKICEIGKNANGNVGAVVGATSVKEFGEISKFYGKHSKPVPLLVPGVGSQGGSATEIAKVLRENNYDLGIVRINSSSGISYAHEAEKTTDFQGAAVRAIGKLNKEIQY